MAGRLSWQVWGLLCFAIVVLFAVVVYVLVITRSAATDLVPRQAEVWTASILTIGPAFLYSIFFEVRDGRLQDRWGKFSRPGLYALAIAALTFAEILVLAPLVYHWWIQKLAALVEGSLWQVAVFWLLWVVAFLALFAAIVVATGVGLSATFRSLWRMSGREPPAWLR